MLLKDIGEDALIKHLSKKFSAPRRGLIKAVGDDASVTAQRPGRVLLATTDSLIQDTHFSLSWAKPFLLGKKALAISLSDIAAMGGEPLFFLVSLAVPPATPKKFIDGLYKGMSASAKTHGVALAGGNTARAGKITITTAVFGEAEKAKVVYRSGGKPGDIIYVTGTLGDSALGLKALKSRGCAAMNGPLKKAVMRHLSPAPRVDAGRALAGKKIPSAMMDISDGLMLDLKRLCKESRAGAEVYAPSIPLSDEFKTYLAKRPGALTLALTGGEDYELLFTAPEAKANGIARISKKLGVPITAIGKLIQKQRGLMLIGADEKRVTLDKTGFEHF